MIRDVNGKTNGMVLIKQELPNLQSPIVYTAALENNCGIVTGDSHFKGLDRVIFVK